jgi:hypothetical protein
VGCTFPVTVSSAMDNRVPALSLTGIHPHAPRRGGLASGIQVLGMPTLFSDGVVYRLAATRPPCWRRLPL